MEQDSCLQGDDIEQPMDEEKSSDEPTNEESIEYSGNDNIPEDGWPNSSNFVAVTEESPVKPFKRGS